MNIVAALRAGCSSIPRAVRRALMGAALVFAGWSHAIAGDPGYYVVTVYDDPGVKTLDLRYWTVKAPDHPAVTWPELGLGWNVNGRWYTELLGSWIGSDQFATRLQNIEWQNDLLLTQGQYPIDVAIHTLLVMPQQRQSGYSFEIGPALQTDIGRTQLNLNVILDRGFGDGSRYPTQLKYQWQVRHRWLSWLHVGAQGFGELGTWDDLQTPARQSHRAGPALFGTVRAGPGAIGWQAAYLLGKTYGMRADMFTLRIKYDL